MIQYVLDKDGTPIPCDDLDQWSHFLGSPARQVAYTELQNDVVVSTIFLGLDHNFSGEGPPILWETMILWAEHDSDHQERYSSKQDALAGHKRAVEYAKNFLQSRMP